MLKDKCNSRMIQFSVPEEKYYLVGDLFLHLDWKAIFELKRVVDENNQKQLTRGTKKFDGIGFYEGELKDGELQGKGMLYKMGVGLIFKGEFEKGKLNGHGKRYWMNGDYYEGEFNDSRKNGKGILKMVGKVIFNTLVFH